MLNAGGAKTARSTTTPTMPYTGSGTWSSFERIAAAVARVVSWAFAAPGRLLAPVPPTVVDRFSLAALAAAAPLLVALDVPADVLLSVPVAPVAADPLLVFENELPLAGAPPPIRPPATWVPPPLPPPRQGRSHGIGSRVGRRWRSLRHVELSGDCGVGALADRRWRGRAWDVALCVEWNSTRFLGRGE